MAINITTVGSNNIGLARAIRIQSNRAATGDITVATAGSTQYGTSSISSIGLITNPLAAGVYEFGGLHTQGNILINVSTTCDISVTKLNQAS